MRPSVTVTVSDGNLGRRTPSDDNVSALIMSGVAASELALNTVSPVLHSIGDAEDLGIDSDYDDTNTILVWYHINEFFKANPNAELYVLLKSQATTLTQMADKDTANGLKSLLQTLKGKIKQVGIARNPASGYTPTLSGGLDADVVTAIAKAQELAQEEFNATRPVLIVVEGRSLNGTLSAATDMRAQLAPYVAVPVLQDKDIADNDSLFYGHAAVGTVLGMISKAKVSEDIGWPEQFRIDYDAINWQNPGLSNHTLLTSVDETDLDELNDLGYITPRTFSAIDGVFAASDPVCNSEESDYAFVNDVRTINKAVRIAYKQLTPKTNSPLKVDPTTGYLASETVKYFEQLVSGGLETDMQANDEISGKDVFIDPKQQVATTSELDVKISIINIATGRNISVTVGFAVKVG